MVAQCGASHNLADRGNRVQKDVLNLAAADRAGGPRLGRHQGYVSTYEKFGVPSYRIIDPDPKRPELTVFELRDSRYLLEARTAQTVT